MARAIFAVLLFLFSKTDATAPFFIEEECLNYTVYPVQYELTIIPYISVHQESYYMCEETITVIANAPNVYVIELDAKDLEISNTGAKKIKVLDGNHDIISYERPFEYVPSHGKLRIFLREPLKQYRLGKTQYQVKIYFKKNLRQKQDGVFLVPYHEDGITKYMIVTRLSPDKAKYFFACFGNSRFEAIYKFRVYMLPHADHMQYSNTSLVISQEHGRFDLKDGYILIEYIGSPQVGLHQVGFVHCTFEHHKFQSKVTGDVLAIWAPRQDLNYYNYILKFGESILNLINEYATDKRRIVKGDINIVTVLTLLDGYEIGSWNLLTNGDNKLAYKPQFISIKQEERMTFELAQQLARIWLGNPGEPERTRWKEEWFKEGVATYLAYYFLAQYHKDAQTIRHNYPIDAYALKIKHRAMELDWHHSTPALAVFNRTLATEIPPAFKELVNMKTASLLWMVETWIGSRKFHDALVKYIKTRRGQFISLDDFLDQLDFDTVECQRQFFNGSTSSRILRSWFHQRGYPVIKVNVLRDRTPNAVQLKLHQFSFSNQHQTEPRYLIPVSYVVQNNQNCYNCHRPRFTIDSTYTFAENLNGGWIILNRNASGYYRVNYDDETWRLIAKTLKENTLAIDEQNRAQIVNDVFALYAAGEIDYDLAKSILEYLDRETSPIVWDAAINGFNLMKIEGAKCNMDKVVYGEWQGFMRTKVAPIYNRLITNQNYAENRVFRTNIIEFATVIEYEPALDKLSRIYENYVDGRGRLDPDFRRACYYIYIRSPDRELRTVDMNLYEQEDRISAENQRRFEDRFLYLIPRGSPYQKLISSTSAPTILSTEKVLPPPQKMVDPEAPVTPCSSTNFNVASILITFSASLLVAAVR